MHLTGGASCTTIPGHRALCSLASPVFREISRLTQQFSSRCSTPEQHSTKEEGAAEKLLLHDAQHITAPKDHKAWPMTCPLLALEQTDGQSLPKELSW